MCSSVLPYSTCDSSEVIANPQNWSLHISEYSPEAPYTIPTGEALPVNETSIQYCLSQRVEEHCKLQFNLATMVVVIICNLGKNELYGHNCVETRPTAISDSWQCN